MKRIKYILINNNANWIGVSLSQTDMVLGNTYTMVFYGGGGIYVYDSDDKNCLGWIESYELCHFATIAEWRERQIKTILDD